MRLLCCLLAILSCTKRIMPESGASRTAHSGASLRFGEPQAVPEGTQILWDFGDGTPGGQGPSVMHTFQRPGVYTVVETIRDKDGQSRSARTHVVVLRRTVQMAVPPDVRASLMVPTPWTRMAVHREVAAKLALGSFFDEVARGAGEGAGFDVLDVRAAEANGLDPDEGVALFTVPQDPEALVFAVGTFDDEKSLAVARRLLTSSRPLGRYGGGPFQLSDGQLSDGMPILVGRNATGDRVAVLQRDGYLYLRLAGATDPAIALRSAASVAPEKSLATDAGFAVAARHIGNGDAIFYSRAPDRASVGNARFSSELGVSAFAVYDKPENREFLQIRMFAQLKNLSGDQLVGAFKPLLPPPDLASRLPADAAAYLRISAAPQALWRELTRTAGADAARLRDRIQETTGLDLEKDLIPSFAGNVGIGVYLDATSLIEAILGEQVGSFDRSAFVVAAQLTFPQTVQAALERAMRMRPAADRADVNGAAWFRLGDGAQAAIREDVLFLALGGAPPRVEEPGRARQRKRAARKITLADLGVLGRVLVPQGQSLGQHLKKIGLAGFDVAGQQNVWVDIAGIVRSIERAAGAQGGIAGQGARLFAERAADLRDALFEVRPGKEGVDADLWLRFLPPKKSAAQ
jgi:PKD repeat protein